MSRQRGRATTEPYPLPEGHPHATTPHGHPEQRKEGDIVVGRHGKTAVATLVERTTRLTIHIKVASRRTADVTKAVARRMRRYRVRSITWDQGKEMADHADLTRLLGAPVYFADAHSPWQRGSNENSNGVTRRHLPKGTALDHSARHLRRISHLMNNRPMAVLSWQTPNEAYARALTEMHRGVYSTH